MELKSTRRLEELKEVLRDENSKGPDVVYWVFKDISENKWEDITVLTSGDYNKEFPKTYGHYHAVSNSNETYKVVTGEGIFLLQKKFIDENNNWIPEKVEKVYLIKAKVGDEITVTKDYGHSWSNIGELPLITLDDWREKHVEDDYKEIKRLKGMAYYLIKENDEKNNNIKVIPNTNYRDLPNPQWITAEEFKKLNI